MNKQVLQMKYHPAKKEVEFHCFKDGEKVEIDKNSRLMYYINLKGRFVLQDYGNTFFDDIVNEFDEPARITIQVITTKMDYEDFQQMVELYNAEKNGSQLETTLLSELPDMKETFFEVKKYGEQAILILKSYRQNLFNIPLENENVKKSVEGFVNQIDEEIANIKEKMDSLSDNKVSLCFTGVYSAGKSALINAILGYRILPEDIKSETAKMFQILSPEKGENVKIKFKISDVLFELEWKEEKEGFEFTKEPSENAVKTEIRDVVDGVREEGKKQYEQINRILSDLNSREEVSGEIIVLFPVSLDSEKAQFIIYDTPGTDSNYIEHQRVLNASLEEQRQSILIFVAKPDGLEGAGNNVLLNYLKDAEEKNIKTSIDIGRSLFVINKADGQTINARMTLQQQEIKNKDDENFSIKLEDKKLFFLSALYGYAAKAVNNNIATPQENGLFEAGKYTVASEDNPMGYCFRQNHCATSEYMTGKMLEQCENTLTDAKEKEDAATVLYVCSGLYALESEIRQYGEKFASTVKAYAIIDSVDKTLRKLSNRADVLNESRQMEMEVIESNIAELKKTICKAIEKEYNKASISSNAEIPENTLRELRLDKYTLNNGISLKIKRKLDNELKGWFFGMGKVKVKERDKLAVRDIIIKVFEDYTNEFLLCRENLLEKQRDDFMENMKNTIMENGKISESAKKYFLEIPAPAVTQPNSAQEVGAIYDAHRRTDKILLFETEYLDKEGFIAELGENLMETVENMCKDYVKDYHDALEALLQKIKSRFETNLDEYSLHMKAMIEDRNAIMRLGDKIAEVAGMLTDCQEQLNEVIWKEIEKA